MVDRNTFNLMTFVFFCRIDFFFKMSHQTCKVGFLIDIIIIYKFIKEGKINKFQKDVERNVYLS